jgi:hypothetical protein
MDCPVFRPDHNGECLNCDEWADAHTPEALAAGEAVARGGPQAGPGEHGRGCPCPACLQQLGETVRAVREAHRKAFPDTGLRCRVCGLGPADHGDLFPCR